MLWFLAKNLSLVVDEYIPAAMSSNTEWKLSRAIQRFADCPVPPRRSDQEQEASTAGAEQFAADGARFTGCLIPLVDLIVADPEAQRPLQLPSFVEQRCEFVEVSFTG
jgi:hypothetical protein